MTRWGGKLILCALLLMLSERGVGQSKGFGLGIVLGEPTGISGKTWTGTNNAIDMGLAWAFTREGYVHIHLDYLWHFQQAIQAEERFVPYTGVGGRLGVGGSKGRLGVRFPGGIAYWPRTIPLDVFLEIALIMDLAPATQLSVNGGIGVRYYFP